MHDTPYHPQPGPVVPVSDGVAQNIDPEVSEAVPSRAGGGGSHRRGPSHARSFEHDADAGLEHAVAARRQWSYG